MNASRIIINTHDQLVAAGGGVAIVSSSSPGTNQYVDGVLVYRIVNGRAVSTDTEAAWYHYGRKHFSSGFATGRAAKSAAFIRAAEEAQKWVSKQGWYSGPWVRNAMRDYVPEEIQSRFPIVRAKRTVVK